MPEHVSIEYDHPGKCPLCGMTLVPVTRSAREAPARRQAAYYTCPMPEHSDVHADKPGKCPKCGMTLIPVMAAEPLSHEPSAPHARDSTPARWPHATCFGQAGQMPEVRNGPGP